VTGSTTPTRTLTANPNGTFTLTESDAPVRAKVGGVWRNLDASLVRNSDGTFSPAVSSQPLALSGGGTGPLATMTDSTYSLALTAPMRLPTPQVAGDTATYHGVLPGVDLIVTAQPSGGFSEVLDITTAAAAANPALRALTFTTTTHGVTLKTAANGSITAVDRAGQVIFSAPAPQMWDSATAPSPAQPSQPAIQPGRPAGLPPAAATAGQPAASTAGGPGPGAHTGPLGVRVAGGRITLAPDRQLLTGPGVVYPEYLDPTWDAAGPAAANWAYVSQQYAATSYYDTDMTLQVGQDPDAPSYTSYAYYELPIPSQIYGAVIDTAYAYFPEVWADSCTISPVQLWLTSGISKSTTWGSLPTWESDLGSDDVAYGWSPDGYAGGPPPAGDPACGDNDVTYTITGTIATAAADSWPTMTVGLQASDTSDATGWKQFADPNSSPSANATVSITYADTPETPGLSTSPTANCTTGTSVLGNGNVSLDATANDVNGTSTGSLTVTYNAYADGNTNDTIDTTNVPSSEATSFPATVSATSGTTAALQLSAAELGGAVEQYGSNDQVPITWTATVSDGLSGVPSSPTASCTFIFSIAIPGQPQIIDSKGLACGTETPAPNGTLPFTAGTAYPFTLEPNNSSTAATEPTSYTYQLNGGNPITVPASPGTYSAAISITPTGFTNVLTVEATAVATNIGQANSCTIDANAPGQAADQDLTGDGIPDLLTIGNATTGMPSGLWLADGQAGSNGFDGTVDTIATDIAPLGPQDLGTPASWNGWRAITGQFDDAPSPGFNDIEAYDPGTQDVFILTGNGNGTIDNTSQPLQLTSVFSDTNYAGSGNTIYPLQLVNAYHVSCDQPTCPQYADQIGLFNDPQAGAYLAYFQNDNSDNSFDTVNGNYGALPWELTNTTPDGTMDWTDWTITTANATPSQATGTDMWLWNQTTGALYLWQLAGLTSETAGGFTSTGVTNPSATLSCTVSGGTGPCGPNDQTEISTGWNQGTTLDTLQATEVNDFPGLITVNSTGQVQSWYLDNNTTLTQASSSQQLITADHTWLLNDQKTGTVTIAADQPGTATGDTEQDMTGNTGTTWNTSDPVYSPDVAFDGKTGYLTTPAGATGAFNPDSSFTISAWVNLSALGGTVFSQNVAQSGSGYSWIEVSSTTTGQWSIGVNDGDTNVVVPGGTAQPGLWTNLTLTYNTVDTNDSADVLALYVNGVKMASLYEPTPPATPGPFVLGASQSADGGYGSYLAGELADVEVWHSVTITPTSTPVYTALSNGPVRVLDGVSDGPGGTISVPVTGTDGVPSSGVTAVVLNLTVTDATEASYVTVYADGSDRPATSNLNVTAGETVANLVVVPVDRDGAIDFYNNSGSVDLIADLQGYYGTAGDSWFDSTGPVRVLDTRNGTGGISAPIGAGASISLQVAGIDGVPSSGVTAVVLNLTATEPTESSYITAYADGQAVPGTSNLNFTAGETVANLVVVPVGSDGRIDFYNDAGSVDLVADLEGYYTTAGGSWFNTTAPQRLLDGTSVISGAPISLQVTGIDGVPSSGVTAVVVNLTVTNPTEGSYITAYADEQNRPGTSTVIFSAGETIADLVVVPVGSDGKIDFYNNAGTVDLIVDIQGYYMN
jgi:hypothetical protein